MNWFDDLFAKLRARRLRKNTEPLGGWQPKQVACWTCHKTHELPSNIRQSIVSAGDFFARHEGHEVNWFEAPGIAGLWTSNADVKVAYGSSAAYTIGLASLASSSTWLAGRESTVVSNTTNLYLDYQVGGRITNGTTPTVNTIIEVSLYGGVNDTPAYGDVLDGTDSAETIVSVNVKKSLMRVLERMVVDATTGRVNWFGPVGIAQHFGGTIPKNHGIFVAHNCVAALDSTAGNHVINYTGVFQTVS